MLRLDHLDVRFCEGFRMPADDDGAACTDGRRRKASKGGNRGLAGDAGAYGDLSAERDVP